MKIDITTREGAHERPTCVYCRDEVGRSDALGLCPACGVTFHEPCRAELSRCPTPGCVGLDEEAFTARQRADEEAEREARRAEARARRDAEDRGVRVDAPRPRRAPARAVDGVDWTSHPVEDEAPRVWRATGTNQLAACFFAGALVGGVVGLLLAYVTSRRGLGADELMTWVPPAAALGALDAVIVGALGVRRGASSAPALSTLGTAALATAVGAGMALDLGATAAVGAVLGLLVGLPLALRLRGVP